MREGVAKDYSDGLHLARERHPDLAELYNVGQIVEGPRNVYEPPEGADLLELLRTRYSKGPGDRSGIVSASTLFDLQNELFLVIESEAIRAGRSPLTDWEQLLKNDAELRRAVGLSRSRIVEKGEILMAIATLNERTSNLAAAKAALTDLWRDLLDTADGLLRDAVAARRTNTDAARLTRISASAHVARALGFGGFKLQDLDAMEKQLQSQPHRLSLVRNALHVAEKAIESSSWRVAPPATEDALLAAVTADWVGGNPDRAGLKAELAEHNWNVWLVLALAYRRVSQRAPKLFGAMDVTQDKAQTDDAAELVNETLAWLRENPQVAAGLCERYGVEVRPGIDPVRDLFDAGLAAASRA